MEQLMITVPYGDFVDGQRAIADLDSIRALVSAKGYYSSDSVKIILGIEDKED